MSNPTIKQIQAPDGTVYDIEATKADTLTGLTSTVTELNYCDGVTSNIQTQLNNKQAAGSYLSTTGTAARATADSNGNTIISTYERISKDITTLSSNGTISLTDNSINKITPTGTITFTLPSISDTTVFHQILIQLTMNTVVTIDLGTTYFFNATTPDLSSTGIYNIIYEYDGSHWVCGAIKKGVAN